MPIVTDLNGEQWLPQAERERRETERRARATVKLVGLDLGQSNDYTALCAVVSTPEHTTVHGLERMRGVPYIAAPDKPSIVARVQEIMQMPQLQGAYLLIDRTGVGRPVFDAFVAADLKPIGISITGGSRVNPQPGGFAVPKRDLVFSLVSQFQAGRVRLPKHAPESAILANELTNFRMKINTKTAHDSYEAWREAEHDDLIMALAMTTWYVSYKYRPRKVSAATMIDPYA